MGPEQDCLGSELLRVNPFFIYHIRHMSLFVSRHSRRVDFGLHVERAAVASTDNPAASS